jgi:hypothetical protein
VILSIYRKPKEKCLTKTISKNSALPNLIVLRFALHLEPQGGGYDYHLEKL